MQRKRCPAADDAMTASKPMPPDTLGHCARGTAPAAPEHVPQQSEAAPSPAHDAGGYSSPACYAHEIAPGYFGETPSMAAQELLDLLDRLLQAERAGSGVAAGFRHDYDPGEPGHRLLSAVQREAENNCGILAGLIGGLNATPRAATGDFVARALATRGKAARLAQVSRHQQWVADAIGEALSRIEQRCIRDALCAMRDAHLLHVEACDALIETLQA
jgi:hypothetical protein